MRLIGIFNSKADYLILEVPDYRMKTNQKSTFVNKFLLLLTLYCEAGL